MRKSFSKRALLATTLLSGLTFAGAAYAQDTTQPTQDPNVQTAPTDQTPATTENAADTPAQDPQDAEAGASETIVVTGSRIASPNITSLAPVQVIGETDIDNSGAVNLQEVLLENPALGTPLFSTTNSAFTTSGAGSATIDLRDLGSNRTLVLINSRRVVGGFGGSPIVDLNTIPTQFIERVDILTGGASSLYGSDAVAGVVNIIYKRNFEGLLLEGQYGITERGDSPRYQLSATAGGNFMEGRGNIMVHLGYSDDKGLLSRKRKNTRIDDFDQFAFYYDPDLFGTPYEPYFSSFTPQGRFSTGDLVPTATGVQQYTFTYGPNGQLQPCFTTNGGVCGSVVREGPTQDLNGNGIFGETLLPSLGGGSGPNGFNRNFFRTLSTPVERWLFAERGHFDITDNISFITEATYSKTQAKSEIEPFALDSGGANPLTPSGTVPIETFVGGVPVLNPFVPAELAAVAIDTNGDGLKDIAFRKRLVGVSTRNLEAKRDFFRLVTGFEGKVFGDRFNWDLTYNYGRTDESQKSNGQVNVLNFLRALAAVPGPNGTVVCSGGPVVGVPCVPIDIFGFDSITPAQAAFVAAETNHSFKVTQQVFAGNLSGSLFDLPAGPLGVAIGAEYRKEESEENWDALTNAGLTGGNALPDTVGEFNVKEIYGEVNVPVLAGRPFFHQLNLRASGRLSDYSTVGGVNTWAVGADWAPIEALRFRGTYAKAVRAPNIGELFTGPSQTFPVGIIDPCLGVTLTSTQPQAANCRANPGVLLNIQTNGVFTLTQPDKQGLSGFTTGNPALGEETAHSLTAGVVFAPRNISWLRNFVLSVDYFNIKIDDAVTFTGRQTELNQCYIAGNPVFCALIVRYPVPVGSASAGAIQFINVAGVNASVQKTAGIDTVVSYRTSLDRFMGGLDMSGRVAWTHYLKGYIIPLPGLPKDPYVGEVGTARDKVNGSLSFNTDKWGVSFSGTYIGKSYEDDVFLQNITNGPFPPHTIVIDPEFYLDSQINFQPSKTYEFFVGVDNMLDNKAPNLLSGTTFNVTGSDTAAGTYDIFGRRYYAGARLRF